MKWTKEHTCALESNVFFIQDNLHKLTSYMEALLLSLGLNPFDGQSLPIHKCNTNGGHFLEDGSGKLDLWQGCNDALPSPRLNPLEGPTMLNCRKLGLGRRSRLPVVERGRGAC
jgi:hypothetical protein